MKILEGYILESVLKESEKSTTMLVKNQQTGMLCIQKNMVEPRESYLTLKELKHKFLPEIYMAEIVDGKTVVLEEYIEGDTIGSWIGEPDKIILRMKELCQVLEFLHGKGIIHRDIKPSNLMVGGDGHLRLIDFDAARQIREEAIQDTSLLGTRGYAAPEQYGFKQTDARTDIYAIGITLDQLLEPKEQGIILRHIIQKATLLDPNKRYQTAKALEEELDGKRIKAKVAFAMLMCILAVLVFSLTFYGTSNQEKKHQEKNPNLSGKNSTQTAKISKEEKEQEVPTDAAIVEKTTDGALKEEEELVVEKLPLKEYSSDDLMFYARGSNQIILSGSEMITLGRKKTMEVDLNGDGAKEEFAVYTNTNNGIVMEGTLGKPDANGDYLAQFLNSYYWLGEIYNYTDESGKFRENYYAQITTCDLDGDNKQEVVVSIGDKEKEVISAVYTYSGTSTEPFKYCGYLWGATAMRANNEEGSSTQINAPLGPYMGSNIFGYWEEKVYDVSLRNFKAFDDYRKDKKLTGEEFMEMINTI